MEPTLKTSSFVQCSSEQNCDFVTVIIKAMSVDKDEMLHRLAYRTNYS